MTFGNPPLRPLLLPRTASPASGVLRGVRAAVLAVLCVLLPMAGHALMETLVALCDNRLVATHYGLYSTVSGLGITLGNLAVGAVWDFAQNHRMEWLTWGALVATGLACAASVIVLARTGILTRRPLLEVRQA
ncbi:hypothetical protein AB0G29_33555 [Streptomyces parvus]|uniref:hypothetical protein n=1 Tax=Streptomyces parvus TaxID=66428 RepID=UPI0033C1BF08